MPHLVATLIFLSQNYSYYIRGDRSPLIVLNLGNATNFHIKIFKKLKVRKVKNPRWRPRWRLLDKSFKVKYAFLKM